MAPSVFWLLGTTFNFLVGKEFPVFDRVINPFEALRLLPQITLVAWETLGWASAAMCAFASGVLAYLKVRPLREPPASTWPVRVLNIAICCRHDSGNFRYDIFRMPPHLYIWGLLWTATFARS